MRTPLPRFRGAWLAGLRPTLGALAAVLCVLPPVFSATIAPSPSVVPSASPGASDIRAIVPPQPYFLSGSLLWLVVAAVSLLLAGLVAWYLLRRPKAPAPAGPRLSPREAARQRLTELERRMDTMDARTFGAEMCDVLRVYIGGEYRMQPERQTSPEFLASVANSRVFSQREHTLLTEFLDGCDLLKFARIDTTPAGKRALLGQAREFLDGGQPDTGQPPLPPPPVPVEETAGAGRL